MLVATPPAHTVVCDTCGATDTLTATAFDAAFDEARAAGWLDHARRGKGRARWEWSCPGCKPKGSASLGASVSAKP